MVKKDGSRRLTIAYELAPTQSAFSDLMPKYVVLNVMGDDFENAKIVGYGASLADAEALIEHAAAEFAGMTLPQWCNMHAIPSRTKIPPEEDRVLVEDGGWVARDHATQAQVAAADRQKESEYPFGRWRCAECDCERGGRFCNWIKAGDEV